MNVDPVPSEWVRTWDTSPIAGLRIDDERLVTGEGRPRCPMSTVPISRCESLAEA